MARRYRCTNCNTEFVADKAACATCEIDATADPRAAGVIVPLVTIHYDPPHPKIKHRGMGHRACDPARPIGSGRGTGAAAVVNCEACKATPAFQAAVKRGELKVSMLDEDDEEITLSSEGVVVTNKGDCGCK